MFSILGKVLGSDKVIEKGLELIDDAFESESEKRESKTEAKIRLLQAYEPFKLAQRYLALIFTLVFVFIMLNGVVGSLYGFIDISRVEDAKNFANSMWLGEIMLAIISFYFGGGLVESVKRSK